MRILWISPSMCSRWVRSTMHASLPTSIESCRPSGGQGTRRPCGRARKTTSTPGSASIRGVNRGTSRGNGAPGRPPRAHPSALEPRQKSFAVMRPAGSRVELQTQEAARLSRTVPRAKAGRPSVPSRLAERAGGPLRRGAYRYRAVRRGWLHGHAACRRGAGRGRLSVHHPAKGPARHPLSTPG